MGPVRLSRRGRAAGGYAVGTLLVAVGTYLLHGLGWALIVAGISLGVYALVIYDVDEPEQPVFESTLRRRPPGNVGSLQ